MPIESSETYLARIRDEFVEQGELPPDRDCLNTACALAWRRLEEGGQPELLGLRPPPPDPQLNLFPSSDYETYECAWERFPKVTLLNDEGRLSWNCHVVCAENGWVLDPLLPEVVPLEEYMAYAVEQDDVICEVLRDSEQLRREYKAFGRPWNRFTPDEFVVMHAHRDEHVRLVVRKIRRSFNREFMDLQGNDTQGLPN